MLSGRAIIRMQIDRARSVAFTVVDGKPRIAFVYDENSLFNIELTPGQVALLVKQMAEYLCEEVQAYRKSGVL